MKYLFYKYYRFAIAVGNKDIAVFQAFVMSILTISFNILTFYNFINLLMGVGYYNKYIIEGSVVIINVFVILYINPISYVKIIQEYSQESENRRKKGIVVVSVYTLSTFLIAFLSLYLLLLRNRGEL